jgi:hypothetical protein
MKPPEWIGALLLVLMLGGQGQGGLRACDGTPQPGFWHRFAPAGGWNPYGGGVLHWWDPHCFPRCGGPDDYCRKPLPRVCWPARPTCPAPGPAAGGPPQLPRSQDVRKVP